MFKIALVLLATSFKKKFSNFFYRIINTQFYTHKSSLITETVQLFNISMSILKCFNLSLKIESLIAINSNRQLSI